MSEIDLRSRTSIRCFKCGRFGSLIPLQVVVGNAKGGNTWAVDFDAGAGIPAPEAPPIGGDEWIVFVWMTCNACKDVALIPLGGKLDGESTRFLDNLPFAADIVDETKGGG